MPSSSGSQVNRNLEGECQAKDLAPLSPGRKLQDTLGLQWQLWEGCRGQEGRSCESLYKFMGETGQNWQVVYNPEFSGS